MTPIQIKIGRLPGHVFSAYDTGNRWNGWVCPLFSEPQAKEFIGVFNEEGHGQAKLTAEADASSPGRKAVVVEDSGEERVFADVRREEALFYPIGSHCWEWEKADPREALSSRAGGIFEDVTAAMQQADEIGGPGDYNTLMAAIEKEARERREAYTEHSAGSRAS